MGNFKIPLYQYVINSDEQAVLLADKAGVVAPYGELTDLLPTDASHLFKVEGELGWIAAPDLVLLDTAVRVRKETASAGIKQVVTVTITSTTAAAGDVFRIVTSMPSLEVTAYQNIPLEKRYQIAVDCASADEIADAIVASISADTNALVAASKGAAGEVVLTDKSAVQTSAFYSSAFDFTSAVTTAAAPPVGTYDELKNKQWAVNVDFDRNEEYYPRRGVNYNSYYFEVQTEQVPATGGDSVPSQVAVETKTAYIFYVAENTTLATAFDALVTDMNV